jgi:hypothetical protein
MPHDAAIATRRPKTTAFNNFIFFPPPKHYTRIALLRRAHAYLLVIARFVPIVKGHFPLNLRQSSCTD